MDYNHGGGGHSFPHEHEWDWSKNPPRQPGIPMPTPTPIPTPVPTPVPTTVPNANLDANSNISSITIDNLGEAAGWAGAGVAVYWIISEGTRVVFPPRNLVPIP